MSFTVVLLPFLSMAHSAEITISPYLQSATSDSIWVLWETDEGTESVVEWGPGESLGESFSGSSIETAASTQVHEVQLTGLSPSTRYFYRVRTDDAESAIYDFITPPLQSEEKSFRLLAMSDMQVDYSNPTQFEQVVNDGVLPFLASEFGGQISEQLDLALIPGDLVTTGNFYYEWKNHFFSPAKRLFRHVPVYPVLGNHEDDTQFYFDFFHLPENGVPGFEEHWWYQDHSNVRIIGLDSNSSYRVDAQLLWLESILAEVCDDPQIDFVFAQLHHPFKSELWLPGEISYSGDVVEILESFSTDCAKPSVHFFGHTHGYSRGQSRDHRHMMVNVASAGGAIDRWGEYEQRDYSEFSVSHDDWGFVLVEVGAGDEPYFRLRRVSMGNEDQPRNNEVLDDMLIHLFNEPPEQPQPVFPVDESIRPDCFTLMAGNFVDPDGSGIQGAQWQISGSCDDFSAPLHDSWIQSENWYFGEDLLAGSELREQEIRGFDPETEYCWRIRYRDRGLSWSPWSESIPFSTATSSFSENLVENSGAENGTNGWTVDEGVFESLSDGECDGISPHSGERYFSAGGLCDESEYGQAHQDIDLSNRSDEIDQSNLGYSFSVWLADWSGYDRPRVWLQFLDEDGLNVQQGPEFTTLSSSWLQFSVSELVPVGSRIVRVFLSGTRNDGSDNDSYIDDLSFRLQAGGVSDCDRIDFAYEPSSEPEPSSELSDPQSDSDDTDAEGEPKEKGCSCSSTPSGSAGFFLFGFLLLAVWRRREL